MEVPNHHRTIDEKKTRLIKKGKTASEEKSFHYVFLLFLFE